MGIFNRLTAPKEVRAALGVLDEIACARVPATGISMPRARTWDDTEAFQMIRKQIEKMILGNAESFVRIVQKGASPREWVWSAAANMAGDLVESGQYHVYRGVLNPLGPGEYLAALFDAALDELARMGAIQPEFASEQKGALRKSIADVG